ncbi:hypothetical protein SAICODRAFT_73174 [Saitoella complicata NRRL Y-17804]|uniref:Myb-like domain-containing protein n=1 Tax=Saitoella complicata (strain BCRC 22490 / CBS 7301 / JCM 7358 / NBRC 10748 / NRRL Y-17804) TaxID=698492 RepID=A0A0E9NRS9_SAICN|nr:uncharacterized protein SAICODRAFT_73174 [Saitoella complicata NRRL Y-17804]ODQ50666.1 hypothetical protein SAICODRAFT_73174 [Saitoella complicata NRRL Y-17804]GAO52135.1 hypothetical protein G7K_6221-t1 [Saitoella complicata NRRL Y-17804]
MDHYLAENIVPTLLRNPAPQVDAPKKRGRPPKPISTNGIKKEQLVVSVSHEAEPPSPKRGRGRPKGVVQAPAWTEEDVERITELRAGGAPWNAIAEEYQMNACTVHARFKAAEAKKTVWTEEEDHSLKEEIRKYETEKWSVIASKMGKTVKAVTVRAKVLTL